MDLKLRLLNELDDLRLEYPKIGVLKEAGLLYEVVGDIDLIDPDNCHIWETYTVKLKISKLYPNEVPVLVELSNKIPRKIDNHISESGDCCLATKVEEKLILGKGYTLLDYVQKLVIPFLASQKLVDLGQERPNGEYSHHELGLMEYYKDKFETNNIVTVMNCLRVLIGKVEIGRNQNCFCGSEKKFKKCHKLCLLDMERVEISYYIKDYNALEAYFEE
jgi:hypothetical protein